MHIVGIHGIPARYGGFETLAQNICEKLMTHFDFHVYCSGFEYKKYIKLSSANLYHIPIRANGILGILYDFIGFFHSLFVADIILYLGPSGSGFITILNTIFRKKLLINHGGLNEWEREKLNKFQKIFSKFNHYVASKTASVNIVDNKLYKNSLIKNFKSKSSVVAYGGDHGSVPSKSDKSNFLCKYPFIKTNFALSVSRAQVDNNLHLVLNAFESINDLPIVLISNWSLNSYGKNLYNKYKDKKNFFLINAVYDLKELNFLRSNAHIYIHSHSRCGAAPSLIEAMYLSIPIISIDNPVNRETTKNKAIYFKSKNDLVEKINSLSKEKINKNSLWMKKIADSNYTWDKISNRYKNLMLK